MLDATTLTQLLAQGGIGLVTIFIASKVIIKLYNDMRADTKLLMDYLDKKNESDIKIAEALERITTELTSLSAKVTTLETVVKGAKI